MKQRKIKEREGIAERYINRNKMDTKMQKRKKNVKKRRGKKTQVRINKKCKKKKDQTRFFVRPNEGLKMGGGGKDLKKYGESDKEKRTDREGERGKRRSTRGRRRRGRRSRRGKREKKKGEEIPKRW